MQSRNDPLARPAGRRRAPQQPGDPRVLAHRARGGGRGRLETRDLLPVRRGRRHDRAAEVSAPSAASSRSCRRPTARRSRRPGSSSTSARREADVQEATRALYAADWTHNAAIQNVVLNVAQEYYRYLNAKAQVVAREASLEEARRNLAAAEERHRAGVATIADVLQAKTSGVAGRALAPGRAGPGPDHPRLSRHRARRPRDRSRRRRRAARRSCRSTRCRRAWTS